MLEKKSLRAFNLNTLPILREILVHGSVTKAAEALNISQPALSAALKQLRLHFDDELVVRVGGLIKLTDRGARLLEPLERAISAVHAVIGNETDEHGTVHAGVRVATTDAAMMRLVPPLTRVFADNPPSSRPQFLHADLNSLTHLLKGGIDLMILPKIAMLPAGPSAAEMESLRNELVYYDRLVAIGPANDARLRSPLSVDAYLQMPHASFALDAERHVSTEQIFLALNSYKQNDLVRVSSYLALPSIVVAARCISLIPETLATAAAKVYPLQVFDPPLNFPPLEMTMVWHRRNEDNGRLAAFREIMKMCAGSEEA